MSSGQPRPHKQMLGLAIEVVKLLAPYCTRIAIAGSLRRGKPMVGDIEIVCAPDEIALPTAGRKGFLQVKQNGVNWICDRLRDEEIFAPRLNEKGNPEAWSERHKRAYYKGAKLDLFIVLPDRSWGYTMLLRTGPGDANSVLVTKLGVRNHDGHYGILPKGYQFREGELWYGEIHVDTAEERDVFAALDLPYMPPPLRSVELYQRWASRRAKRVTPKGYDAGVHVPMFAEYGFGDEIWIDVDGVLRPRILNVPVGVMDKERVAS